MFNTTFTPDAYADLEPEIALYERAVRHGPRIDHPHRRWEHCLALKAIRQYGCQTVLDVGSANSGFPLMVSMDGRDVYALDSDPALHWLHHFVALFSGRIDYEAKELADFDGGPFDAVCALSVIEHVQDDAAFLRDLARRATKLIVVTTDFSPTGKRFSRAHLRTYSPKSLQALVDGLDGWTLADGPDWTDTGAHVNDYNFAAVVLVPQTAEQSPENPPAKRTSRTRKTTKKAAS